MQVLDKTEPRVDFLDQLRQLIIRLCVDRNMLILHDANLQRLIPDYDPLFQIYQRFCPVVVRTESQCNGFTKTGVAGIG